MESGDGSKCACQKVCECAETQTFQEPIFPATMRAAQKRGKEMSTYNEMKLEFSSNSENESFARTVVSAFVARLDPTLEELADVKTAVSEAVTNAIIHGYEKQKGMVRIYGKIEDNTVYLEISDEGEGISDIAQAMEPLYTSKPELDRSGMGFAFMEAFMDDLQVESEHGKGTVVKMKKIIYSAINIS